MRGKRILLTIQRLGWVEKSPYQNDLQAVYCPTIWHTVITGLFVILYIGEPSMAAIILPAAALLLWQYLLTGGVNP